MIGHRQILTAALVCTACACAAVAQNNTNSPYTRYGYGQLATQGSANSRAMGGTAYALRDRQHTNTANPASYSAVDSLTFIFDGGLSLHNTNLSNGTLKKNAKNSSFDYVTMEFRACRGLGISLGLLPYSNVGYSVGEYREDTEFPSQSTSVSYNGEGGLHQIYMGAGLKLLKNLSVGANVSYLWGDVTRTATESFPSNSTVFPLTIQSNVTVKSYKLDFGAQYTQPLGRKSALTVGVVFSPGHDLKNDAYEIRQTGNSTTGATSTTRDTTASCGMATTWGAGVAYSYDNRLTVAADVTFQQWSKTKYMNSRDAFCDYTRLSAGVEWVPNPMGRSYLSYVKYRLGAYYSKPYYKIDGVRAADEFGLTAGFGLPIPRTRSVLSLTAQYVKVSGKRTSFLDEQTLRLSVGVTFNERWFFKRKVD